MEEFEEYEVLNLPYQRVGIKDIKLFNFIGDSVRANPNGTITANIEFRATDYYNLYAKSTFNYQRITIPLTDIKVYHNRQEIITPIDVEYSDFIEIYLRFNNSLGMIPLNDLLNIPLELINTISNETLAISNIYWITKYDELSPNEYYRKFYYAKFEVPKGIGNYTLQLGSFGTQLHNIYLEEECQFSLNVNQESLSEVNPIYLEQDQFELNYGDTLL